MKGKRRGTIDRAVNLDSAAKGLIPCSSLIAYSMDIEYDFCACSTMLKSPEKAFPENATPTVSAPWALYDEGKRGVFLVVLFLVITSNNFDYSIFSVLLEPIKKEFQVSDSLLGQLTGTSFALFYVIAAIPIARWADRGNRRTVLGLSIAVWSLMTIACGLSRSFTQMAVARMGVGASEPGATPTVQSLVADYFPPTRRSRALALVLTGGAVGQFLGIGMGGIVTELANWRTAFFVAGWAGVLLGIAVILAIKEPRSVLGFPGSNQHTETLRGALIRLGHKRSYLIMIAAVSMMMFVNIGITTFMPSFMIRSLHANLRSISITWGLSITAAQIIGALAGGVVIDQLCRKDIRWHAWLSALGAALMAVAYWAAFSAEQMWQCVVADFFAEGLVAACTIAVFSTVQAVCGQPRRALALAIMQFSYVLFGVGLGPLVVGTLSDGYHVSYGEEGLRHALLAIAALLIVVAGLFQYSARWIAQDAESETLHAPLAAHSLVEIPKGTR
jgi:predicted MFS family arabinose efflux permease